MDTPSTEKLIAAVVTWVVEQGSYVTKTKLLKLLYLFDIEYYRVHRQTFTGFSWKFFHLAVYSDSDRNERSRFSRSQDALD